MTIEIYLLQAVTWICHNGRPTRDGDRKTCEVKILIFLPHNLASVVFWLKAYPYTSTIRCNNMVITFHSKSRLIKQKTHFSIYFVLLFGGEGYYVAKFSICKGTF